MCPTGYRVFTKQPLTLRVRAKLPSDIPTSSGQRLGMWPEAMQEKKLDVRGKGRADRPWHGPQSMPTRGEPRGALSLPCGRSCPPGPWSPYLQSGPPSLDGHCQLKKSNLTANNPVCSAVSSQHPRVSVLRFSSLNSTQRKAWGRRRLGEPSNSN